jgi:hypothetical protein
MRIATNEYYAQYCTGGGKLMINEKERKKERKKEIRLL